MILGAQKVSPAVPTLFIARASSDTAAPTATKSDVLKDAAVRIGSGKLVALGVGGSKLTPGLNPTPWVASDHTW